MPASDGNMLESRHYQAGLAVAGLTAFLTIWTTVVRDDGHGLGFFLLILTAAVGGFAASFRPAGMARTMCGVAVMQILVGLAIATAPVTLDLPGAATKILLFSGVFASLWLISATCFHRAAKGSRRETAH